MITMIEQAVSKDSYSPQVTLLVEGLELEHLRCEIFKRSANIIEITVLRFLFPCKAEVNKCDLLGLAIVKQVLQLQVSVCYLSSMQVTDAHQDLIDEFLDFLLGEIILCSHSLF